MRVITFYNFPKLKSFLEKHRKDLEKLAIEHIEKIKNYKANLTLHQ